MFGFDTTPFTPYAIARFWYGQAQDYTIDAWQRSVLFLDVLRQRGDERERRTTLLAPNVLNFAFEVLMDGRELAQPVNYGLLRIVPPEGVVIDPASRPFIVFDPRAGHGPGIGGMKHDSEIGEALRAGHPCYFVGFLPTPVPGQSIEDVCEAEAQFIAHVASLHPGAPGKPALIGNCQAGWQIMMSNALHPELSGPVILAGAPLSYWAGVHGKNPLRYLGGLLGGTWLTALSGDLGHGIFDGALLVSNFESMNPANTLWSKDYRLYSRIDTEAERFLEFEKWWGNPVLLNAGEMQTIADDLFVGNRLSDGGLQTSTGQRIDLRNITAPIVVFCSWGDDITPPQQALGWVLDLYEDEEALIASGQTIIYALHASVGHLGIFVSASVANKEHEEFTAAIDMIDLLPPGLYQAVISDKTPETAHAELASGNYVLHFERRGLDDLRALGGNDEADERRFATVARVSDINLGLYRSLLAPWVQALTTEASAERMRAQHPYRQRFSLFSSKQPWLRGLEELAQRVRADRKPVAPDNLWLGAQQLMSQQIVAALDGYRTVRDQAVEACFLGVYGSPLLQAAVGLGGDDRYPRRIGRDLVREEAAQITHAELMLRVGSGGTIEAVLRALLYIFRSPQLGADERAYATLRQLRLHSPELSATSLAEFKRLLREQFQILALDEEGAVDALALLLPEQVSQRQRALEIVRQVAGALGTLEGEGARRLGRIAAIFGAHAELARAPDVPLQLSRESA
ncbi:DUF3141 domain-containing protein [Oxalobacteraceae bacterium]|nr:DUF3141 domain-containing protein [Oxalobacteraceae bacterium]